MTVNLMYNDYREQFPRGEGVVYLPKREHDNWANLTGGAYSAQSITSSFPNIFVTQPRPTLRHFSVQNTKLTTDITVPSSVCRTNAELHWAGKQNLWGRPTLRHSPQRASSRAAHQRLRNEEPIWRKAAIIYGPVKLRGFAGLSHTCPTHNVEYSSQSTGTLWTGPIYIILTAQYV
jgi:hypothetical protein